MRTDLWDCVAPQLHIPAGDMRQAERNYVADPLDLVYDGVRVGQVGAILHGRLSGLSDHSVYLSLDLCCPNGTAGTQKQSSLEVNDGDSGVHLFFAAKATSQ